MEDREEKRLLFEGGLAVEIPDSFQAMEDQKAAMMFPYEERPQLILEESGANRFCTFSLLEKQSLVSSQVKDAIFSIADAVARLYPSCLLQKPRLVRGNRGTYGWFAFRTSSGEGTLYNIMYVYPVNGAMMLGTMGCLLNDEEGKAGMSEMLRSLEVPEKKPARAKMCIDLPRKRT